MVPDIWSCSQQWRLTRVKRQHQTQWHSSWRPTAAFLPLSGFEKPSAIQQKGIVPFTKASSWAAYQKLLQF
jgi:hypothetical protein